MNIQFLKNNQLNDKIYGVEDVSELANKIKESGYVKTILITPENVIISGHRRVAACKLLGINEINVEVIKKEFQWQYDELFLLENASREKTEYQKTKEYEFYKSIESEKANIRKLSGVKNEQTNLEENFPQGREPQARDIAASIVSDKSGKTMDAQLDSLKQIESMSEDVKHKAIKVFNEKPSDIKKVLKLEPEVQKEVLAKVESGEAKSIRHAINQVAQEEKIDNYRASTEIKPKVEVESYATWLPKMPKCDLIVTDPPYITEFESQEEHLKFATDFVKKCEDSVKDGKAMYICIGAYPEELQNYLSIKTKMKLQNILVWTYNNLLHNNPKKQYSLNYQNILYYSNDYEFVNNLDSLRLGSFTINAPDGRLGNRFHGWQKPEELADMLISNTSSEGDVIYDPCCCTGTFILSANKFGRIGYGCDINKENLEIAIKRGCEYV